MSDLKRLLARTDDLRQLSREQQEEYYIKMCERYGLDPLDRPFRYSTLSGRMTLYLEKTGADQLRTIHKVSVYPLHHEVMSELGVVVVWGRGVTADGREEFDVGSAPLDGKTPKEVADAFKKAVSSLKRRLTISLIGAPSSEEEEEEEEAAQPAEPEPKPAAKSAARPAEARHSPGALLHAELKRKLGEPGKNMSEQDLVNLGRELIRVHGGVQQALDWVKSAPAQEILAAAKPSEAEGDLLVELEHG